MRDLHARQPEELPTHGERLINESDARPRLCAQSLPSASEDRDGDDTGEYRLHDRTWSSRASKSAAEIRGCATVAAVVRSAAPSPVGGSDYALDRCGAGRHRICGGSHSEPA